MTREERRPCCRKIATKGPDVLPGDNRSLKEAQLSRRDNVELLSQTEPSQWPGQ